MGMIRLNIEEFVFAAAVADICPDSSSSSVYCSGISIAIESSIYTVGSNL